MRVKIEWTQQFNVTKYFLEDTSDVVARESAKEPIARVGTDKPSVVALLKDVDDVPFVKLQFVGVVRAIIEHCSVSGEKRIVS